MTEENVDWLFPDKGKQQAALEQKGLIFAQKYLVFHGPTSDPRARELLAHWQRLVRRQLIPPNASASELAYYNARREFVEGIDAQIEIAMNGATAPQPRTTT